MEPELRQKDRGRKIFEQEGTEIMENRYFRSFSRRCGIAPALEARMNTSRKKVMLWGFLALVVVALVPFNQYRVKRKQEDACAAAFNAMRPIDGVKATWLCDRKETNPDPWWVSVLNTNYEAPSQSGVLRVMVPAASPGR